MFLSKARVDPHFSSDTVTLMDRFAHAGDFQNYFALTKLIYSRMEKLHHATNAIARFWKKVLIWLTNLQVLGLWVTQQTDK